MQEERHGRHLWLIVQAATSIFHVLQGRFRRDLLHRHGQCCQGQEAAVVGLRLITPGRRSQQWPALVFCQGVDKAIGGCYANRPCMRSVQLQYLLALSPHIVKACRKKLAPPRNSQARCSNDGPWKLRQFGAFPGNNQSEAEEFGNGSSRNERSIREKTWRGASEVRRVIARGALSSQVRTCLCKGIAAPSQSNTSTRLAPTVGFPGLSKTKTSSLSYCRDAPT